MFILQYEFQLREMSVTLHGACKNKSSSEGITLATQMISEVIIHNTSHYMI